MMRLYNEEDIINIANAIKSKYIPSEYKQVEYITADGNQYIDTQYNANSELEVEIKADVQNTPSVNFSIFGSRINWNQSAFTLFLANNDNMIYCNVGNKNNNTYEYSKGLKTFKLNKNGLYVDGTQVEALTEVASFSSTYPITLFKTNTAGSTSGNGLIGKLYYAKIKDNDVLVRDFVPCYRVSDNAIGLYDKVNKQFYTNAGTGSLGKGAEIKYKVSDMASAIINIPTSSYENADEVSY